MNRDGHRNDVMQGELCKVRYVKYLLLIIIFFNLGYCFNQCAAYQLCFLCYFLIFMLFSFLKTF